LPLQWLPSLSDQLSLVPRTYPVLVHGFPTSFDSSRDSDDVVHLLNDNDHLIPHLADVQHTEFLTHSAVTSKAHSSLILYSMDPTVGDTCIKR
jgi:hypothetical protein